MPKNHRNYQKTRHIALSGLLFALAMSTSSTSACRAPMKNRAYMTTMLARPSFMPGFTAGFLSLCGGLLSLAVMWVLYYLLPVRPTWFILSVCGALAHNVGQLLGAGVIISSSLSLYYAPVMLVLGLVMGALTSVTLRALLPALGKMGLNTHENRPE